jgi:hypothetical protein
MHLDTIRCIAIMRDDTCFINMDILLIGDVLDGSEQFHYDNRRLRKTIYDAKLISI